MKKIAFICESLSFGGIERVINILSSKLIDHYQIDIIVTTNTGDPSYKHDDRINVIKLSYNKSANKIINLYRKNKKIKELLNNGYDLVLCFGYKVCMSVLLNKRKNMKVIISERTDPDSYCNNIVKLFRDKIYKRADLMVCQTSFVKEYYEKRGLKKCVVISNPIKDNLPDRYMGERKHIIVNFCRLNPQKNLKLLFDSFEKFHEQFNDYKLIIYGEGELKDELVNYISSKGLNDCITIENFQKNIHDLIIDNKMFVSSSDYEGISNSMLESLAIGLPTICTDCPVGGASLAITSYENGILVPIKNEEKLTAAMVELAANDELCEKLSKNSVKIKERFSANKISELWIDNINILIEKGE